MKHKILLIAIGILLFYPKTNFGQAPDLGAASSFAVFTAAGAFEVYGASTVVTGDVGTNVGAFTGFPPGTLIGNLYSPGDPIAFQAAADVGAAYGYLNGLTCGMVLANPLGNGQSLTPNIYCLGEASTLNGDLTLDGQNNPDALFIFQIDGAFATSTFANIFLTNSASECNVYWQINGAFTLGEGSVFRGTVIANGAIHLLEGSSYMGRALSQAGAIDLHNNIVTIGLQPIASVISASGSTQICLGDSVLLTGNDGGIWNNGSNETSIIVKTSGDYYVTSNTICGSVTSNHIIVSVNVCGGTPIPISTWALILGGVFIAVFAFVRYRHLI